MRKIKTIGFSPAQIREQKAKEITRLTNELTLLRAQMLSNMDSWGYEQMSEAMTRANNIRKERDKLMKP